MTFAYPWVLVLLVVPLLLVVWTWKRSGQRVVMPFDGGVTGRGRGWRWVLDFFGTMPALLLAVVVVVFAGPQRVAEPKTKRVLTNIQFALDVSGSMMAAYGEGTRYDAAMEAINEYLDYREGDAFGLTIFGGHFLHWIRLTNDPSAFRYAPPFLAPGRLPRWFSGGTRIGMALEECLKLLVEREEGDRMILLVSDGYSADLSGGRDEEIGRKLAANGVVVYGVHVAEGEVPTEVGTIASLTGGEVFSAGDPEGLKAVFRRIDAMQETRLEKVSAESMDDFEPVVVVGLSVLGVYLVSLFGLRYTPW